jgi:hypothetical protein
LKPFPFLFVLSLLSPQIGCLVWFSTLITGVLHIAFLLQSTALNAEEIGAQFSAFLRQWREVRSPVKPYFCALVERPLFPFFPRISLLVLLYSTLLAGVLHIAFLLQSTALHAEGIGTQVNAFLRQWLESLEVRALSSLLDFLFPLICCLFCPLFCGIPLLFLCCFSSSLPLQPLCSCINAAASCVQLELTEEAFTSHIQELIKSLQEKPRNLSTLSHRWKYEILIGRFNFRWIEAKVAELRRVSREDFIEYVDAQLLKPDRGRRLVVNVAGAKEFGRTQDKGEASGGNAIAVAAGSNGKAGADGTASAGNNSGTCDGKQSVPSTAEGTCDGKEASIPGEAEGTCDGEMPSVAGELEGTIASGFGKENCVCNASTDPSGLRRVEVLPDHAAAFRMHQQLWPMVRAHWKWAKSDKGANGSG